MIESERVENIFRILTKQHYEYLHSTEIPFKFSNDPICDERLKNIKEYPEYFFIGCLMDRQIPAERAWTIPYLIHEDYKNIKFDDLKQISLEEWIAYFEQKGLHRFNKIMAKVLYDGISKVVKYYKSDPSNIWNDTSDSNKVVKRFRDFSGVGEKISTMAANILYRDFKIPFDNLKGIDISPDSQVRKVFYRLGLINDADNTSEIIQAARKLNPSFPGIFDVTTWEIGRRFCDNTYPHCDLCPLDNYCIKKNVNK